MSIFNFNSFLLKSQLFRAPKQGFLLLEALFALLLVASISIVFGLWFMQITNERIHYINTIKALNYSSNILEHVKIFKNLQYNLTDLKKEGFGVEIDLEQDVKILNLKKITVSIVFPNKKNRVSLSTQVIM